MPSSVLYSQLLQSLSFSQWVSLNLVGAGSLSWQYESSHKATEYQTRHCLCTTAPSTLQRPIRLQCSSRQATPHLRIRYSKCSPHSTPILSLLFTQGRRCHAKRKVE